MAEHAGNRLRRARVAAGLTQFQLAVASGCSVRTIGAVEQGGRLSREAATKLAPPLGVTAQELLGEAPPIPGALVASLLAPVLPTRLSFLSSRHG